MAPTPAAYVAWTSPINPPDATPVLTRSQVWAGLEIKVKEAQAFVPQGISSTDVIETRADEAGRRVTTREVEFREGNRRVREEVTEYKPARVDFAQPDGSHVQNIISDGVDGGLYMTYSFEWMHPGMDEDALADKVKQYRQAAQKAVDSSIQAIRDMVESGRITA